MVKSTPFYPATPGVLPAIRLAAGLTGSLARPAYTMGGVESYPPPFPPSPAW